MPVPENPFLPKGSYLKDADNVDVVINVKLKDGSQTSIEYGGQEVVGVEDIQLAFDETTKKYSLKLIPGDNPPQKFDFLPQGTYLDAKEISNIDIALSAIWEGETDPVTMKSYSRVDAIHTKDIKHWDDDLVRCGS